MKIVIFTHPAFLVSQSMPRFAKMLREGMESRGHEVEFWTAKIFFYRVISPFKIKKWLGYIDQFLIFPIQVKIRLRKCAHETLFVFADQALGPWVPLVANRPHAIHCHDFLAQRSALNEIPENVTGWTGRQYQSIIRKGYCKGRNFISVSQKTKQDLHRFTSVDSGISEVVYNGLNSNFAPMDVPKVRSELMEKTGIEVTRGFVLHVGGNQWYKNRIGIIEIYNAWRSKFKNNIPLLLVGQRPDKSLEIKWRNSSFKNDIYMLDSFPDEWVKKAYAGASVFLFPSLAEGFGWPIAEAMASGCPVITTNEAPMTEVAQDAAFLIPKRPSQSSEVEAWSQLAADVMEKILVLPQIEREKIINKGLKNSQRFNSQDAVNKIEQIYNYILKSESNYESITRNR